VKVKSGKSKPAPLIGIAFGVSLSLAIAVLSIKGTDTKSIGRAMQLTARWSFLWFWMAYAGNAMADLFGPFFDPLARRGREFGLAFAAALLVHLSLVIALFVITSRPPLTGVVLAIFLAAVVCTYSLAIFSFGGLAKALGSSGWYALRLVAMNYILFAFAFDFVRAAVPLDFVHAALHEGPAYMLAAMHPGSGVPIHYGRWRLIYVPFAAMNVAAPLLVLAAAAHRRLASRSNQPKLQPIAIHSIGPG
jgi:hypothetical protein